MSIRPDMKAITSLERIAAAQTRAKISINELLRSAP
jgi:hypothetical protein